MSRIRLDGARCIYCGELANQDEHFPPATYSAGGFILPCCGECNVFAGTQHPVDFWARADFVRSKIRKKYRLELTRPDWDENEIKELGPNLRKVIRVWQKQKKIAKERLAWDVEGYLSSIDQATVFAQTLAEVERL